MNNLRKLLRVLPDKPYLQLMYFVHFKRFINFGSPKTYNEKLQWLKLYDRKPEYSFMVDKYRVKEYVSNIIGSEYVIPTYGMWKSAEDIDFDGLPNQFVLKCNNDSGGIVICRDKSKLNKRETMAFLSSRLKNNGFWYGREWPYKNVEPCIIAEQYMESKADHSNGTLNDYKVYTINGKSEFCMINQDRGIDTKADYFDRNFNYLDFTWGYKHARNKPCKPVNYEKMFLFAEKLSKGIRTLRVDFYEVDGQLYFGELTFYDGSGFNVIKPDSWDLALGNKLILE